MSRSNRAVAIFVFMVLVGGLNSLKAAAHLSLKPQIVEGGMWRREAGYDSILHLKNVLTTAPLDATPSVVFSDGTRVALPVVHLEAAGVASINLGDAIDHLPLPPNLASAKYGMVRVQYTWSWTGALMASIQNVNETEMLSFHNNLQSDLAKPIIAKDAAKRQVVYGNWWKPYTSTNLFAFLGNAGDDAKDVKLSITPR